jgi:dissimilatory sulfite reductase (desulfoviridin) alpha/beta subunit
MFGHDIKEGLRLLPLLFDREQVCKAADIALGCFRTHSKPGERMGRTLARAGSETLKKELEEPFPKPG